MSLENTSLPSSISLSMLRNQAFSASYQLPDELINVAKLESSHYFLTNPTALICYLYLVDYVDRIVKVKFSEKQKIRILDWGCGKGHISYLLKNVLKNVDVTSCDVSEESAKDDSTFGQKTPIIETFQIEVIPLLHEYILPFEDESFDIVLSIGVLEHVPSDAESLKEINRVLTSGGLFFCAFLPYTYSWTQKIAHMMGNNYHDRLYDWGIVKSLLSDSHFKLLDKWHRSFFPKNNFQFPMYRKFESLDQFICENTPLKHLATNIEFVAEKNSYLTVEIH